MAFRRKPRRATRVRRRRTRLTRKTVWRMAKRAARSTAETKMQIQNGGYAQIKHDSVNYMQLFTGITQGTSDSQRIGDEIYLKKVYLKMVHYSNPTTSKPATFRVMVIRTKKESAPTDSQLFNGTNWFINRFANREYCSVLYDRVLYSTNSAVNTHPTVFQRNLRVNFNRTHKFSSNNGTDGKYFNYYFIVIGHIADGTQGTTDAGLYGVDVMTTYKDA